MIPKIIHYCWFGNGEMEDLSQKCIESWKKKMPEYEIMLWNEETFDIHSNAYVEDAYNAGKYAFVSDYVRLYALFNYGGIYLDTDVEVIKSLDKFLDKRVVLGFEAKERIGTAVLMFEKNNLHIKKWLESYDARTFYVNKKIDMTTNVKYLSQELARLGCKMNGETQSVMGEIEVYEQEVFFPYAIGDKKRNKYEGYTIHWCEGSWVSGKIKFKHRLVVAIKFVIGERGYYNLKRLYR